MGEACDPMIYYKRVREYMGGWRNNPRLPHGLVYGSHGRKEFYGETGVSKSLGLGKIVERGDGRTQAFSFLFRHSRTRIINHTGPERHHPIVRRLPGRRPRDGLHARVPARDAALHASAPRRFHRAAGGPFTVRPRAGASFRSGGCGWRFRWPRGGVRCGAGIPRALSVRSGVI